MATDLQIAANRRNSQKSTGPSTPEGRHASSLNALRHGLNTRDFHLSREDAPAYYALRDAMFEEWNPQGPTETLLVDRLITSQWRLLRCDRLEAGYFDCTWFRYEPSKRLPTPAAEDAYIYECGAENGILPKLTYAYYHAENSFHRALRQLRRLRKSRSPQPSPSIPSKLASFCENRPPVDPPAEPVTPLPHSDGSHNQNEPDAQ